MFSSAEVCDQFSLFALLGIALHYYCSESIKMPRTEVGLLGRSSILKLVDNSEKVKGKGEGERERGHFGPKTPEIQIGS